MFTAEAEKETNQWQAKHSGVRGRINARAVRVGKRFRKLRLHHIVAQVSRFKKGPLFVTFRPFATESYLPPNWAMQQSLEAMQLALRVLTAVTEKRYPDPEDVAQLRQLAPDAAAQTPDELACHVIQSALKQRAAVRQQVLTA